MTWAAAALWLSAAALACAQVSSYTSESDYLAAVTRMGYTTFQEGFEDDAAWGPARSPKTTASIATQGMVWTSNHPTAVRRPAHITTGDGAARTGRWGIYSLPHGDPDVVNPFGFMRDGFAGSRAEGASRLYGVGGWFTGFPGSKISVVLEADETRLVELGRLTGAGHQFYGVIDTRGFSRFEVRELEGKLEDQKFIFADDLTFAADSAASATVVSVSAASLMTGKPLAPGSLASAFGVQLAAATERAASLPLPLSLGGTSVQVTDSAGVRRAAPLLFVSPGQVNYLVPEGTATGPATLTVLRGQQAVATGSLRIEPVAPGLFAANADGRGAAAAMVVKVAADGSQTTQLTFQCGAAPGSCVASPVELGSDAAQAFLTLFGTGIRGRSALAAVNVKIGGVDAQALYAGPQGEFAGLDQVNVKLPANLGGETQVILTVDGRTANPVGVNIR